jgi:hypothetical protein
MTSLAEKKEIINTEITVEGSQDKLLRCIAAIVFFSLQ